MADPIAMTLWPANVRGHSLLRQLEAASTSGCAAIAINPATFESAKAAGLSAADIRDLASELGVRFAWIDAVSGWLPVRFPPDLPELKGFLDYDLDLAFEIASDLGADNLLAIGCFDRGAIPVDEQVAHFAALSRRAAAAGMRVALEFIPMWGIASLQDAWSIVRDAGSNAGLMVDTWHFFRSDGDFDVLDGIPGERIFAAQVADARHDVHPAGLIEDCLSHRLLPGEGDLPIERVLRVLLDKGVCDFGPEIFSGELDALSADEAAGRSVAATRHVLARAAAASTARRFGG